MDHGVFVISIYMTAGLCNIPRLHHNSLKTDEISNLAGLFFQ